MLVVGLRLSVDCCDLCVLCCLCFVCCCSLFVVVVLQSLIVVGNWLVVVVCVRIPSLIVGHCFVLIRERWFAVCV